MVCEMWRRGTLAARLPMLRAAYQRKRTVMEQALRRELPGIVTWPEPKGGFFLWASFADPVDTDKLLPHAVEHSVSFVPGSAFFVEGSGSKFARLSFSWPTPERIELGVARLAQTVREALSVTEPSPPATAASAARGPDSAAGKRAR
jgi:2-aminoadipate transaminase